MANLRWENISDWDNSQDESGTNHSNDPYTSSSPQNLKQGYEKQWPPLTHGLVGWWPLHTDKPVDLSGNQNHDTLNGGVTTGIAGKAGLQAMSFDGTDDYIDLGTAPPAQDAYAVSFWMKPEDNSSRQRIIDSVGDFVIFFGDSGNDIDIATYDDNSFGRFSDHNLTLGEWHYIYIHYISGSEYAVSVNGQPLETVSTSDGSVDGGGAWAIATDADSAGSANFQGVLCDFRVYNRALTQSEIQTLYEWGSADLATPPNNGTAHYKLNGDATDSRGSNDGTNNGVTYTNDAIRGQAAEFDGSSYITTGFALEPTPLTVSFWFKADTLGNIGRPVTQDPTGTNGGWAFRTDNAGEMQFFTVDDNPENAIATGLSEGEWYHCVGIVTPTGGEIWINSERQDTSPRTSDWDQVQDEEITIGAAATDAQHFDGIVDDVRIYERALNPQEIQELYRYGTKGINLNKHTVMK